MGRCCARLDAALGSVTRYTRSHSGTMMHLEPSSPTSNVASGTSTPNGAISDLPARNHGQRAPLIYSSIHRECRQWA